MKPRVLVRDLVAFIRTYGPAADHSPDEMLEKELAWYLSNNRALVLKDHEGISGVCLYQPIEDPKEIVSDNWPVDSPNGKYLYVTSLVVHPVYRNKIFLMGLMAYAHKVFPGVKWLIFKRGDPFNLKTKMIPIDFFNRKGVKHV